MRVLTIDLDYITTDYSRFLETDYHKFASIRWEKLFNETPLISRDFNIDSDNLLYIIDVFSRSIEHCSNVVFGIDHESILYELDKTNEPIDLINIDQHHDIAYSKKHFHLIEKYNIVSEGSWVWYLNRNNRISTYKWICTETSMEYNKNFVTCPPKPGHDVEKEYNGFPELNFPFVYGTRDKIGNIDDFEFDFIYLTESPQYVHPNHWFYMHIFRMIYRNKYGEFPKQITQKYEWDYTKQLHSWGGELK